VTVKTFMIYFEMRDFIKKWGTIGMFNEDAFESRHAKRNVLKRRYAGVRCIQTRDRCMNKAYASIIATRAARDAGRARTSRKGKGPAVAAVDAAASAASGAAAGAAASSRAVTRGSSAGATAGARAAPRG
jgi:hypothetical protein